MNLRRLREEPNSSPVRVLLVEDDAQIVKAWTRELRPAERYAITAAPTVAATRELLTANPLYDVVLLDLLLPDGNGTTLLDQLRELRPRPALVVVSGYIESDVAIDLMGKCDLTIPKPVSGRALRAVIARLTEPEVSASLVAAFCTHHGVSPRESELLLLAAKGIDNDEAASLMKCQRGTVTTFWRRIFKKTGHHSQRDVLAALLRFELAERF
ncbi:MAG: response regulator transcription factor [Deltaproteobacteria bacterium]|nr:response regulator transcription factor [Deltaproteobacteria bacterium]